MRLVIFLYCVIGIDTRALAAIENRIQDRPNVRRGILNSCREPSHYSHYVCYRSRVSLLLLLLLLFLLVCISLTGAHLSIVLFCSTVFSAVFLANKHENGDKLKQNTF